MIANVYAASRRARHTAMTSRAWLDGVEVTHDCQFADTRRGLVLLLKRRDGRHYVDDNHEVAREWRRGKVRIERAERRGK